LVRRYAWREFDTCYACTHFIRCTLKDCDEWVLVPYITCSKHTALLFNAGFQPTYLMDPNQDLRSAMTQETIDRLDENDIIPVPGFRFSASYASRYHKCHGSARLEEAIQGFQHPERNENGMKGEGTKRHKIFEVALSSPETL